MKFALFLGTIFAIYDAATIHCYSGHQNSGYQFIGSERPGYVKANTPYVREPYQTNRAQSHNDQQTYTASIQGSRRNVKIIDVPSNLAMPAESMTIQVPPSSQPLTFVLQSRSSQLNLQSVHQTDPGSYKESNSEDGLHVLVHTVTRPVLQEIREIISPYRKVTQEIKPMQENLETVIAQETNGTQALYQQSTQPMAKPQRRVLYQRQIKPPVKQAALKQNQLYQSQQYSRPMMYQLPATKQQTMAYPLAQAPIAKMGANYGKTTYKPY